MATYPRIFFTDTPGPRRNLLFNNSAQEYAKKLGFTIELNNNNFPLSDEQWADTLIDVDALITTWESPKLNKIVLSKNKTLKIVGHAAGSVDPIVSPELYRRGVKVVSANYTMARSVAEWSLMMTLVSLRGLTNYAQFGTCNSIDWDKRSSVQGTHNSIIGIWGFGDVAGHLIDFLKPFGPKKILVSCDYLTENEAARLGVTKVSLDEIFAESDVIHLLTSLTENSKGAVGKKQLELIKSGATLINAGRAGLIKREDLLPELEKKRFNAIFDVYYTEPLEADSPFRQLENVLLTPHNAGCGSEDLYFKHILDEFAKFFSSRPLLYEISWERALTMTKESRKLLT